MWTALEQLNAELRLQRFDLMTYRRWCNTQLICRSLEALTGGSDLKCPQKF
jgi:hypothetical protein